MDWRSDAQEIQIFICDSHFFDTLNISVVFLNKQIVIRHQPDTPEPILKSWRPLLSTEFLLHLHIYDFDDDLTRPNAVNERKESLNDKFSQVRVSVVGAHTHHSSVVE